MVGDVLRQPVLVRFLGPRGAGRLFGTASWDSDESGFGFDSSEEGWLSKEPFVSSSLSAISSQVNAVAGTENEW